MNAKVVRGWCPAYVSHLTGLPRLLLYRICREIKRDLSFKSRDPRSLLVLLVLLIVTSVDLSMGVLPQGNRPEVVWITGRVLGDSLYHFEICFCVSRL